MFRPAAVNSFGREYKPGRPANKKTRRRIIDLYLVGEGPSAISRSVRVTKGAVWKIIRHYETYGTYDAFSQGGRTYSSKLSDDVFESIELFKLTKPCMYSKKIRERLLNDGICDRRSIPGLSTIQEAISRKIGMSYKKLSVVPSESQTNAQGPVPERCNNSIPGINAPYSGIFIPGIELLHLSGTRPRSRGVTSILNSPQEWIHPNFIF